MERRKREMDTETRAHLGELRRRKRGIKSPAEIAKEQAQREVLDWNGNHQPGIAVTVRLDNGELMSTTTRSAAWVLCDHASILVEGISGGYKLSRVRPVPMDGRGNPIDPEGLYLIQDSRSYVGNCMLFWRPNAAGYCCSIDEAGRYTGKQALSLASGRGTDVAWPAEFLEARSSRFVDFQRTWDS